MKLTIEIQNRMSSIARSLQCPRSIENVPIIQRLLTRAAINELFLEDQELDARFRDWTIQKSEIEKLETGKQTGGLIWQDRKDKW